MLENSRFRRISGENVEVRPVWDWLGIWQFERRNFTRRTLAFLCRFDPLTTFAMWSTAIQKFNF